MACWSPEAAVLPTSCRQMQRDWILHSLLTERETCEGAVSSVVLILNAFCFSWEHLSLVLYCHVNWVRIWQLKKQPEKHSTTTIEDWNLFKSSKIGGGWYTRWNIPYTEHCTCFNYFFPFIDMNCVSSRETGAIKIKLICISEFPILPWTECKSICVFCSPTPCSLLLYLSYHKERPTASTFSISLLWYFKKASPPIFL